MQRPVQMWVVCSGIANLLSLPQLEEDGLRVTYVGRTVLVLNRDVGVSKGFPYLDLNALPENPRSDVAMVQTVDHR